MTRAKAPFTAAAVLLVALLVAGCGGGGGGEQASSTTPPVAAPTGEAQAPSGGTSSGGGATRSAEPPSGGGTGAAPGKSPGSGSHSGSAKATPTRGERAAKAIEKLLHTVAPESTGKGHRHGKGTGALQGIIAKARKEGVRVITPGGTGGKGLKNVLRELGISK